MVGRTLGFTTLIDAATADETTGRVPVQVGTLNLRFDILGTGTITGGSIALECAPEMGYGGTWSAITTAITASDVSGGKVKSVFVQGAFDAIGARLSDAITGGGSITVRVTGNA